MLPIVWSKYHHRHEQPVCGRAGARQPCACCAQHFADLIKPSIAGSGFRLFDLNAGQIVLSFNEAVRVSAMDVLELTLQNFYDSPDTSYRLTGGTVLTASDGPEITIQLSKTDLDAVKTDRLLCVSKSTCFVMLSAAFLMKKRCLECASSIIARKTSRVIHHRMLQEISSRMVPHTSWFGSGVVDTFAFYEKKASSVPRKPRVCLEKASSVPTGMLPTVSCRISLYYTLLESALDGGENGTSNVTI